MDQRTLEAARTLSQRQSELYSAIAAKEAVEAKVADELEPVVEAVRAAKRAVDEAELDLRKAAEVAYLESGDVMPAPGVTIKFYTRLEYSRTEATKWAKEHSIALIPEQLDVKTFEKIAKTSPPDFVTVTKHPQTNIAHDLAAALEAPTEIPAPLTFEER